MQTSPLTSLLAPVLAAPAPLATVCADVSHVMPSADPELDLRVRAIDGRLEESGASRRVREVIAARLLEGTRVGPAARRRGRALVVDAGAQVVLDQELDGAPSREVADVDVVPDLLPVVRQLPGRLPHVVVLADRVGAELDVVTADGVEHVEAVDGDTEFIRKVHTGGWSQPRYQHTAEEVWRRNADRVIAQLIEVVHRIGARFVLLAGEDRARQLVRDRLPAEVAHLVVDTDAGGRALGADREPIRARAAALVAEQQAHDDAAALEQLAVGLHRGTAVTGVDAVIDALRQGQVATLLLADTGTAIPVRVGAGPLELGLRTEDLTAMGCREVGRVPADRALVRAALGCDADVVVVPASTLPHGTPVAALLRFGRTPSADLAVGTRHGGDLPG